MKLILLLFLTFCSTVILAQRPDVDYKFNEGYIITNTGEKIAGKVKYASSTPYNFTDYIKFKEGKEKKKYYADDIRAFKSGDHYFESHKISQLEGLVFLEKLKSGCIDLYFYETHRSQAYYVDVPEFYLSRESEVDFFELNTNKANYDAISGGSSTLISNKEFRKTMDDLANYIKDEEIVAVLKSYEKRKEFMGVQNVVDLYNNSCNKIDE